MSRAFCSLRVRNRLLVSKPLTPVNSWPSPNQSAARCTTTGSSCRHCDGTRSEDIQAAGIADADADQPPVPLALRVLLPCTPSMLSERRSEERRVGKEG